MITATFGRRACAQIHAHALSRGMCQAAAASPSLSSTSVTRHVATRIPTAHGMFHVVAYTWSGDPVQKEHLALVHGELEALREPEQAVLCRVHSECLTGEVLGSRLCDCGEQLDRAMAHIAEAGLGVVLYLRQEGRGIGLLEKLRAYNLQRQGHDTVEANRMLGFADDERDFTVAGQMLDDLGVRAVKLITNNPLKLEALKECGIDVAERVPLLPRDVSEHNVAYLNTKAERMGHLFVPQQHQPGDVRNGAEPTPATLTPTDAGLKSRPSSAPRLRPFRPNPVAL